MSSQEPPVAERRPNENAAGGHGAEDLPPSLRQALRPWIDVETVGLPALWVWLESVIPVLPVPGSGLPERASEERRSTELAKALVECSTERARLNFRAYEYYSDNVVLARRVRALEGMLRGAARDAPSKGDPETERATERYLPRAQPSGASRERP